MQVNSNLLSPFSFNNVCGDSSADFTDPVADGEDEVEIGSYSEAMSAEAIVATADKVQLWSESENEHLEDDVEVVPLHPPPTPSTPHSPLPLCFPPSATLCPCGGNTSARHHVMQMPSHSLLFKSALLLLMRLAASDGPTDLSRLTPVHWALDLFCAITQALFQASDSDNT